MIMTRTKNDNKTTYFPKSEWTMCTADEAHERQRFKELSIFECTNSTINSNPKDRLPDPSRCVKKYRRSAAGGGVDRNQNGRSHQEGGGRRTLEDLEITVMYLLGIIFSSQTSSSSQGKENNTIFRGTLLQSVLFVDDRIRAVQVDLTVLMAPQNNNYTIQNLNRIRKLQLIIIRYHLLSQHLLSNLNTKQYEWKFGHKALTTAITAFYATWNPHMTDLESEDDSLLQLDEVMSYSTFLHLASIISAAETSLQSYNFTVSMQKWTGLSCDDGHGMSAVLALYRKFCPTHQSISSLPKYEWALKVAKDYENGNYLSVIRLLTSSSSPSTYLDDMNCLDENSRWKILGRCCLAQVMPALRIGLLRFYNKSFMKEEKVQDHDLASLLHLPTSKSAIRFCKNVGLPIYSTNVTSSSFAVMKAAPICIQDSNHDDKDEVIRHIINPGRNEDNFVFGNFLSKWVLNNKTPKEGKITTQKNEPQKMSSLQRALAKVKIEEQSEDKGLRNETFDDWTIPGFDNFAARTDDDGVLIIPSPILRQLIFL